MGRIWTIAVLCYTSSPNPFSAIGTGWCSTHHSLSQEEDCSQQPCLLIYPCLINSLVGAWKNYIKVKSCSYSGISCHTWNQSTNSQCLARFLVMDFLHPFALLLVFVLMARGAPVSTSNLREETSDAPREASVPRTSDPRLCVPVHATSPPPSPSPSTTSPPPADMTTFSPELAEELRRLVESYLEEEDRTPERRPSSSRLPLHRERL